MQKASDQVVKTNTDPFRELFNNAKKLDGDFILNIPTETLLLFIDYFLNEPKNEIAGFGSIIEVDDRFILDWVCQTSVGNGGSVQITPQENLKAVNEFLLYNKPYLPSIKMNVQWHTHPKMGTFWSSVDLADQCRHIKDMTGEYEEGWYVFIVFDNLEFKGDIYYWHRKGESNELVLTYRSVKFVWNDRELLKRSSYRYSNYTNYTNNTAYKTKYSPPDKNYISKYISDISEDLDIYFNDYDKDYVEIARRFIKNSDDGDYFELQTEVESMSGTDIRKVSDVLNSLGRDDVSNSIITIRNEFVLNEENYYQSSFPF